MAERGPTAKRYLQAILTCTLVSFLASLTGCSVARTVNHALALQVAYHEPTDSFFVRVRHCFMAREALEKFENLNSCLELSPHFKKGFRAGFHDVLHGGDGKPPVLPPPKYWTVHYRNPSGHKAIEDWFAGFKAGAQWAIDHGCRRWELVPTSDQQLAVSHKASQSEQGAKAAHAAGRSADSARWHELLVQRQRLAKLTRDWFRNLPKSSPGVNALGIAPKLPHAQGATQASAATPVGRIGSSSWAGRQDSEALLFLPVSVDSVEPTSGQARLERQSSSKRMSEAQ